MCHAVVYAYCWCRCPASSAGARPVRR